MTNESEVKLKKAKLAIKALISNGVLSREEITLRVCQHCTESTVNQAVQELVAEGLVSETSTILNPGDRE